MAGGWGEAPPCGCGTQATSQPQVVYPASSADAKPKPFAALRERVGRLFQGQAAQTTCPAPAPQAQPIQTSYAPVPSARPAGCQAEFVDTVEPPLGQVVPAVAAHHDQSAMPEEAPIKIGMTEDRGRVTGQLVYLHAGGGVWVIRYSPLDKGDRYGGSVVLAPSVNMDNFREGDVVSVEGEIIDEGRGSRHAGGPLFRADFIEMIERAN
jgi:hypothetical protein